MHRSHVVSLVVLLMLPSLALASASASGQPTDQQDACKKGSVTLGSSGVNGGGGDTGNAISISKSGQVTISCMKIQPGQKPWVTFCGLDGECRTFDKEGGVGDGLMRIYDATYDGGILGNNIGQFKDNVRSNSAEAVLQNLLTPQQMSTLDQAIVGKANVGNPYMDYTDVLQRIGDAAVLPQLYNKGSFDADINKAIESYAITASPYVPKLESPADPHYAGLPIKIDALSPSENWLYYGPQYVPDPMIPTRALTEEDVAKLNAPNPYLSILQSNDVTGSVGQSASQSTGYIQSFINSVKKLFASWF